MSLEILDTRRCIIIDNVVGLIGGFGFCAAKDSRILAQLSI